MHSKKLLIKKNRPAKTLQYLIKRRHLSDLRRRVVGYITSRKTYKRALRSEVIVSRRYLAQKYSVKKGRPTYLTRLTGPQVTSTTFRDKTESKLTVRKAYPSLSAAKSISAIYNWSPIQKLNRSGLLLQRLPQFDANNKPILKHGKPVTIWDISNRDLTMIVQAVRRGLKFGSSTFDYRPLLSASSVDNFNGRGVKKAARRLNRFSHVKKTAIASLEGWTKPLNSRPGLGFNGAPSKLFGSKVKIIGASADITEVSSLQFRSNVAKLSNICKLPVASSPSLWLRPRTLDLRRCVYRTKKGVSQLVSTSYSIIPNKAIEIRRLTSKNLFLPHWWLSTRLNNLADKICLNSGNSRKLSTLSRSRLLSSAGSGKFFRDVLIQTKNKAVKKRLKNLVPVVTKFGCSYLLNQRYYKTRNKFRSFTTYSKLGVSLLTDRSVSAIVRRSEVNSRDSLGLYQRHPRFTAKMIRLIQPNAYPLHSLIINKQRKAAAIKTFKRKIWLRNADAVI